MTSFDEYIEWRINEDLELQHDFLYDDSGKLLVDYVGKFENIQNDFDNICTRIPINKSSLPVVNASRHTHYKEYYNKHTKNLILTAFKKDIETFKYDF
jgi:hypothetical protein